MPFLSRLHWHPLIKNVARVARAQRVPVYLVGGAVRDALLGIEGVHDFDFVLAGGFDQVVSAFAREQHGKIIDWDIDQKRVVFRQGGARTTVDFSRMTKPDIIHDLEQRDFTVNAMALDVYADSSPLIDPLGGQADLQACCLRMCSVEAFEADPLRMLRAVRLARQLSCEIEARTWEHICCKSHLIIRSARERIKRELFMVLHGPDQKKSLKELHDSGLLGNVLPDFSLVEPGYTQQSFDPVSFEHCLSTLGFLNEIQSMPDVRLEGVRQQLRDYVNQELEEGVTMLSLLVFTAFLAHAVRSENAGEKGHSNDYDRHTIAHIARETGLGRKAQHIVACLFTHRMRIPQMAQLATVTGRAKVRFVLDCGEAAVGVCLFAIADSLAHASRPDCQASSRCVIDIACDLCAWISGSQDMHEVSPLLTGNDVIALLGLGAGPHVGNILSQAAQLERRGELQDRKAALLWLRNLPPSG